MPIKNFFENNIKFLPPDIKTRLIESNGYPEHTIKTTPSGHFTLQLNINSKVIFLNSRMDPIQEGTIMTKKMGGDENSLVIMLGFGLGYALLALKKQGKNNPILIVENDVIGFKTAMILNDFSSVFSQKNSVFLIGKTLHELNEHFSSEIHCGYDGIKMIRHPVLTQLYPDYYSEVAAMISKQLRAHSSEIGSFMVHHQEIVKNYLYNCAQSRAEIQMSSLKNRFPACPAFIVGAGPSLTESLRVLSDIQSQGMIIATDTSVSPLLEAGIYPDFIVAMDYTKNNLNHFKPIFHLLKTIPLIACYSLYHEIVKNYPGPIGWFSTQNPLLSYFKSESSISLTNDMISGTALGIGLANFLGASPIIFIGQDLSYRPEFLYAEKTHKKQIILEKDNKKFLADAQTQATISAIKTVDGYLGPVETSIEMETMIRNINQLTQLYPNTYYNFNQKGAILKTTLQLGFASELKRLMTAYIKTTVQLEINDGKKSHFKELVPPVLNALLQALPVAKEAVKIIEQKKRRPLLREELEKINRFRTSILDLPYVTSFTEYVNFSRSFLIHKKELKDNPNFDDQISMNHQFFLMVFDGAHFLIRLLTDILK